MQRMFWCFLLSFCLAGSIRAQGHWYGNGSVGATFLNVDHNNYISAGPGWPNDLDSNNTNVNAAALIGLEGGYQWAFDRVWIPSYSVGANYSYLFPATIKGTIFQYSLPQFENYTYHYQIQSQTLLAMAKLDLVSWQRFMPFLLVGAGVSLNTAKNYTEQAVPGVTPRVSPGFSDSTNAYFSYALGAGVDYILKRNLWMSLKYQYGNEGYAQTGHGANTSTLTATNFSTDRLKTKLTSNSVLFSLTYIFDPVA